MNQPSFSDRAVAFQENGRAAEFEQLYLELVTSDPVNSEARHFLGIVRARQERFTEALEWIGAAVKLNPNSAKALSSYGNVLQALGRFEEALVSYDKALAIKPDLVNALFNRGVSLYDLKRFEEALTSYEAALAVKPDDAGALYNSAVTLWELKRHDQALARLERVLAIAPDFAEALYLRGVVLQAMKRFSQASESFDRALSVKPDYVDALYSRGFMAWFDCKRIEPALRDFERAVLVDPDYDYVRGDLLHLRMTGGDWRDFQDQLDLVNAGVRTGKRVIGPFAYQAVSQSPADLQACSVTYAAHRFPAAPSLANTLQRNRAKIRVGYVSGEFSAQATSYLATGLYECHDKSRFEIVAFDNGARDASPLRQRTEAAFDKFVDISRLSDAAAAEKILGEEIDILVNLNGYFGLQRMGVFAHKPAPIQVNYLGFPGTLGANYIDYILADRIVIPRGEFQHYSEKIAWLPDSYQVNDSKRSIAQVISSRAENGLPERGFVFCNFNQSYKLTPAMFALWMRILKRVDGSVLWLLDFNSKFSENLKLEAMRQGVACERLVFAPQIPSDKHLARLKLADLFVDSLPYNAHTTASDALWAEVPLLTCRGTAFAGRVAASLLHAINLPELIAENLEDYETLAIQLATDPARLKSIRQKLIRNRLSTPLFDTSRSCRNIEAAYMTMWDRWQRGEPARDFAVPSEK